MRRREIVAGLGSVGALAGAGGLLLGGVPSFGADSGPGNGDDGSYTVETIDARGSEAGTLPVPTGDVMVLEFFVTGCGNCQTQMPKIAEAYSQLATDHGDEVTFLGITFQSPDNKPPAELRDWWRAHGGNWPVGYDPMGDIAASYGYSSYPTTIVTDADGEKHWGKLGITEPDVIVDHVESVLETSSDETTNSSVNANTTEPTAD
ncbi:TlpA family protein disulfide reductase [Haloterrigena sp. H1]|uniref:TlpA family protein disulfide reductase n=1 Tax=Haloterrigena sp. H1 TaxID=2552943 RepID=UPI00110D871E|nr:TlpA disulfide reductase family protein [Haloterrigena sp. H1]TMT85843.1 TlpA family protein disulfide reductase [Haloterrigena sp. H1]